MDKTTIASAVKLLEEILELLDDAYWNAGKIAHKDAIYDVISIIHGELSELSKLSVEDHSMVYEPISQAFRQSGLRLRLLHDKAPRWVMRSKNASQLVALLPAVAALVGH